MSNLAKQLADYIKQTASPEVLKTIINDAPKNNDLLRYRGKPIEFMHDVLDVKLWGKQSEIMQSVVDNPFTVVEAGHSIGKTFLAATLSVYWLCVYDPAVLVTTAPTFHQVNNLLWRYIRQHKEASLIPIPGIVLKQPKWEIAPDRFGTGLSPRKSTDVEVASMQGFHSEYLLVVLDEAAGLTIPLWEACMSLVTGEKNRLLAIGNPVSRSGPFYDATKRKTFHSIRISCLDHPNVVENKEIVPGGVSYAWVGDRVSDWAHETSTPDERSFMWEGKWYDPLPVFEARVLGRPPLEADDQLIPLNWVEDAIRGGLEEKETLGERIIGLDVARHGADASSMVYRTGDTVKWVRKQRGNDITQTAAWLMDTMTELDVERAYIDEIGVGAGVVDICADAGFSVDGVNVSRNAMQRTRFTNMRHELWWTLREKLRTGQLVLPDDVDLTTDLTCPKYSFDALGRIQVEDKDEMRKRIGRSPDSGDALALSFTGVNPGTDGSKEYANSLMKSAYDNGSEDDGISRWSVSTPAKGSRWRMRG